MNKRFRIIEADASHIKFLSDFGCTSFIEAYKRTLPLNELKKYTALAFSEKTILDEMNGSSASYFICHDEQSNPCGYSKLLRSSPPKCINPAHCIELQRLYVDEKLRSHGIGKQLSLHGESNAYNRGIHSIWLRVWDGNILAQQKYLKWNYSIAGKEQYQVGAEERTVILMCKSVLNKQPPTDQKP